jgi:hypothetical protein
MHDLIRQHGCSVRAVILGEGITQCHQFKRKMLFIKRLLVRPQAKRSRGNGGY